jgi:hypothetical protein
MGSDEQQVTYYIMYRTKEGRYDALPWTRHLPFLLSCPENYDLPSSVKIVFVAENLTQLYIMN